MCCGLSLILLTLGLPFPASAEMFVGKVTALDSANKIIVVELDPQTTKEFRFSHEREVADVQIGSHVIVEGTGKHITQIKSLSSPPPGSLLQSSPSR